MRRDPCGVYTVSSVYGALGLNVSCGVTMFLLLTECLGWMLVKVTAFVPFMRRSGWLCLCVRSVCSVYGASELEPGGVFTVLAVFMGRWGWTFVTFCNF